MSEGDAMSGGLREAMAEFVSDLKGFHDGFETRLKRAEERLTMIQAKTATRGRPEGSRPALAASESGDTLHLKAFDAYVRSGEDDALRGLEGEVKSLSTAVAAEGGYLVDPVTSASVASVLSSTASIRAVASVVHVEATSYDVLVDHGEMGHGWASETGAQGETATPMIDRISIHLHELSAMPKASQRLLDDAAFDIEGWLAGRIADRFARAEAAAFVSGNGQDKPRGFLNHAKVEDAVWQWGSLGYVKSGQDGGFSGGDGLVDLVYALGARYRANGTFVMNSKTAGKIRKLRDGDGRFLWSDGLAAGEPARLLGYRVLIAEDMPDAAAGSYAVAFGDFAAGYTIAERPDLRVLRDPFSAKPNVLFYATKRVGGDVSDFAAIKLMRCSV